MSSSLSALAAYAPIEYDYVLLPQMQLLGALAGIMLLMAWLAGCWCYWCCCTPAKKNETKAVLKPGTMTTMNSMTLYQICDSDSLLKLLMPRGCFSFI